MPLKKPPIDSIEWHKQRAKNMEAFKNAFSCCHSIEEIISFDLLAIWQHKKDCKDRKFLWSKRMHRRKKELGNKGIKKCKWNKKHEAFLAAQREIFLVTQERTSNLPKPEVTEIKKQQQNWNIEKRRLPTYQTPIAIPKKEKAKGEKLADLEKSLQNRKNSNNPWNILKEFAKK